jgi:hypothetical protein
VVGDGYLSEDEGLAAEEGDARTGAAGVMLAWLQGKRGRGCVGVNIGGAGRLGRLNLPAAGQSNATVPCARRRACIHAIPSTL